MKKYSTVNVMKMCNVGYSSESEITHFVYRHQDKHSFCKQIPRSVAINI